MWLMFLFRALQAKHGEGGLSYNHNGRNARFNVNYASLYIQQYCACSEPPHRTSDTFVVFVFLQSYFGVCPFQLVVHFVCTSVILCIPMFSSSEVVRR